MNDEERRRQEILNAIPEFSAIEGQKENVMPRRQGRSVAALSTLFQTNAEEREQQLQQGHDEFARELEDIDELDDPLDVFVRYIDWTIQMYPEGHNQHSDLRGLLEEATSRFQEDPLYKDDVRYLKCWLHYIQFLDDPGEAYQLLARNNIGQNLALYYEEYADYLEGRQRYTDANAIYERGIERNARPITRLRRRRNHFITRIERQRAEQRSAQQQRSSTSNRTILGLKYDGTHRLSRQQQAPSSSVSTPHSSRHPQFSVYTGPELDAPGAPIPSSSASSSVRINNPAQRTENQTAVSKFAGTTLPQRPYQRPKDEPAFTVFRDDDDASTSENAPSSTSHIERSKIPKPCEPDLQERFKHNRSKYIRSKDSRGRIEYIAASKACLNNGSDPISFEELRAEAIMKRLQRMSGLRKKRNPLDDSAFDTPTDSMSPDSPTEMTQETRAAWQSINALVAGGRDMSVDDDEEAISFSQVTLKRRIVDENDVPGRRVSMEMSRASSFYDSMDTLDTDDEDDDPQMGAHGDSRPSKRPFRS
ncbi:Mad3/BUB1 homology region 1-domain-containing protein [Fennellomyces sp. T-0311]|nr:Mad3/BUB1 homology region 1-domain-containing protein [Fennellomyces sp. T-0311]